MKSIYLRSWNWSAPISRLFSSWECLWGRQCHWSCALPQPWAQALERMEVPLWEQGGIKVPDFKIEIQKTSVQLPASVNHLLSRHISHFLWVSWVPQSSCITDQQLGARSKGPSREWGCWLSPAAKLGPVLPDQTLLRSPNSTPIEHFFWCRILWLHCVLWPALGGTGVPRSVQSSAQCPSPMYRSELETLKPLKLLLFRGSLKVVSDLMNQFTHCYYHLNHYCAPWSPLRTHWKKPSLLALPAGHETHLVLSSLEQSRMSWMKATFRK